jgi:hypothetical protein
MKRVTYALLFCLMCGSSAWGQNSSMLKSVSKYLPSLTEIGFVTGAINTYIQTATLVRAVNKEIALAKSMSKRLDDLKSETEQMLGRFGSLSHIDPYNMDSWASWLDRAQGFATEETSDFIDILFNSVLKTLDDRMTVGFYAEIKKGLSYDVSQGQVGQVLRAYYMNRAYEDNRDKVRTASINSRKLMLLLARNELADIQGTMKENIQPAIRKLLESRVAMLEKQIARTETEILDPAVGGTAVDRQIAFLMDVATNLAHDISSTGESLERHQKDLADLNGEWELASKDKLPKSKNRSARPAAFPISRSLYDARDPDKVPSPVNDVDKPGKQNTSETSIQTSLSDLLYLQNKVELKKMEMGESALQLDFQLVQAKAILLAINAYVVENARKHRSEISFEVENLSQFLSEHWNR